MLGSLSQVRGSVAAGSLAAFIACSNPMEPTSVVNILEHRAEWTNQKPTHYSYTYQFAAFNVVAYQPLRVEVRQDTVRSVVVLATGDSITAPYFPTIDALFDRALAAAQKGSLTRIAFDPVRSYPTLLDYAANPDALSSQQASALQPLP